MKHTKQSLKKDWQKIKKGNLVGVDPSLTNTGLVVFQNEKIIHFQEIKGGKDKGLGRLLKIGNEFNEIITEFQPTMMAIETQYYAFNVKVALDLSALRGFLTGIFLQGHFDHTKTLFNITPLEAKSALGVSTQLKRDESKLAVKKMVIMMYPELKDCSDDITDAVAIGLSGYNKLRELVIKT